MKGIKPITLVYLIPYLVFIALGIWYRAQIAPVAFFDGDSCNYLIPAYLKALAHEWHKGERPMPYLQFIYLTLSKEEGLKYTVIAQQVLSMLGAIFLTGAWFVFLRGMKKFILLWHLPGYFMLCIFTTTPTLMYYEQLIGPESPCIFVMCVLIFCLTVALSNQVSLRTRKTFIGIALFVNLYLIIPMPKWIFAGAFLELLLIYVVVKHAQLSTKQKRRLLLMPCVIFLLLVYIPECYHKIDEPNEDRTYIEFEQMAYTHFDLLAQDKSNFPLPTEQQDLLIKYYHEAQLAEPNFLIGFGSDNLMWGNASNLVSTYYKGNYDSISHFYKALNYVLVTKYPLGLTKSILKQLYIFYVPNRYAHKKLFNYPYTKILYDGTKMKLPDFDRLLEIKLEALNKKNADLPKYFLNPRYPSSMEQSGVTMNEKLPFVFHETFIFFRWFDHIYLALMLAFFITLTYKRELLKLNIISLLYLLIFIYALTIAIVHTFDVDRFIFTIYPFILISAFMAATYLAAVWMEKLLQKVLPQTKQQILN